MNNTCRVCGEPIYGRGDERRAYCETCKRRISEQYRLFRKNQKTYTKCLICRQPLNQKKQKYACCQEHSEMVRTIWSLSMTNVATKAKKKQKKITLSSYHSETLDKCITISNQLNVDYGDFIGKPQYRAIRIELGLTK